MRILLLLLLIEPFVPLFSQQIILNDAFEDWANVTPIYSDQGDASGLDLEELQITNDDVYLYLRLKVSREMLLQENNNITVVLDFDSNGNTGFNVGGLGAEVYFTFGDRSGRMSGVFSDIFHNDIGLISSPTVSGDEFEIAIKRKVQSFTGVQHEMSDQVQVKIFSNYFSGDELPNSEQGVVYRLSSRTQDLPTYQMDIHKDADFRFLSYNVLRDNLFDTRLDDEYQSILSNVNADVMCFQEIYDHTPQELLNYLEGLNVIDNVNDWHAVKHGPDLISLSRFPIIYNEPINGNGMFVMDVEGEEVVVFNCHLPCCENDDGREYEIDQMLAFIRDSKNGFENYTIEEGTPYIICGDMNFVGNMDQVTALKEGTIFNNFQNGDDVMLDWDDDGMADLTPSTTGFSSSFTWFSPNSSFFPGRLDYIFYTDSYLESMNQFVLNSAGLSVEDQYDLGLFQSYTFEASDHLPVVADFRIGNSTSVSNINADQLEIYPNPSNGLINIDNKNQSFNLMEIYDIQGRKIYSKESPSDQEQLQLDPGIYLIKLVDVNGMKITRKICIE